MGRGRVPRGSADLRRKKATRRENPRILLVAEGEKTEVQYFKRLADYLRAAAISVVDVKVKGRGRDPVSIINAAANETDNGRLVGDRDGYDTAWRVFDVDDHKKIPQALAPAISNPCFELWLLWHFCDCTKHVDSTYLRRALRGYGIKGKDIPPSFDFALARQAVGRAPKDSSHVPRNPGTGVAGLVDYIHDPARAERNQF
ncbi:RloB family protein [Saccharomonospora sp. NPDC046836]|uniref:RloB family protein n=1 Tax=Saccharomonospora sp. NPDC046836 TaxID=3156921 RepID=UPI0033CB130A